MGKQIQKEPWEGHDHQSIYKTAQAFQSQNANDAKDSINSIAQRLGEIMHSMGAKVQGMLIEDWRGEAAKGLQSNMSDYFRASETGILSIRHVADRMPPLGAAMDTAKSKIEPPMSAGDVAIKKKSGYTDADVAKLQKEDEAYARSQMVSLFSDPVVREGNNVQDVQPPTGHNPGNITLPQSSNGNDTGGGHNSAGSGAGTGGGGSQALDNLSKIGKGSGDTKPAFDQGLGDQSGQGSGQGSGAGSPSGGSGGGSPSGAGGSGGGLGSGPGGLGSGSGASGSGLPLGGTTAAGYQPSSGSGSGGSGTGTLGGPGALRGGAGVPGLGGGGVGTNAAGVGGAGIRGGAMGMGSMGMAGMAGAHGRGKGEDDGERPTSELLINWDNGNELFGDLPKASPGVIGDWSEQEQAEKKRREAEKRRYKSLGWDVDFGDGK